MELGRAPRADRNHGERAVADRLLDRLLSGRLLVLAPHMDDEALGCGGALLMHADKPSVHCAFATDGAGSPAPLLPWLGRADDDLAGQRRAEALAAAARVGIPAANLRFFDLPDGGLSRRRRVLEAALTEVLAAVRPEIVLAPFRYDVHPDHTALNRAARAVLRKLAEPPVLLEYFVYYRLRFVPGGDVRRAIRQGALLEVDIRPVAAAKRAALDCYASQTTVRHSWQDRPILTPESLRERCAEPEYFLPADPAAPLGQDVAAHHLRIHFGSLAMRHGKRPKDRAVAFVRWAFGR
jgi:LmbE family N-acetylglucosaminyl deacetylase